MQGLLIHEKGKSLTDGFVSVADCDECLGVDVLDDALQGDELFFADGDHDDLGGGFAVAALAVEDGDAAVEFEDDFLAEGFRVLRVDQDFVAGLEAFGDLGDEKAAEVDADNGVDGMGKSQESHQGQHDNRRIEDEDGFGHGKPGQVFDELCDNVGAACCGIF